VSNRLRLVDNTGVPAEAIEFVDLGDASPGVEMRITKDGGSHVLDELQVGHLQIRAPCVMLGYHDNSMGNAECYPGDDWFDSGDLGFIHAGRLALTGRAKEMIIIRGANFYCYEVEARALEVAGTVAPLCAATSVYDPVEATEALLVCFVARYPRPTWMRCTSWVMSRIDLLSLLAASGGPWQPHWDSLLTVRCPRLMPTSTEPRAARYNEVRSSGSTSKASIPSHQRRCFARKPHR